MTSLVWIVQLIFTKRAFGTLSLLEFFPHSILIFNSNDGHSANFIGISFQVLTLLKINFCQVSYFEVTFTSFLYFCNSFVGKKLNRLFVFAFKKELSSINLVNWLIFWLKFCKDSSATFCSEYYQKIE